MSLFCIHKDKVKNEHKVGEWSDVGCVFTTLVQCEKCGRAKYISSYTELSVRMFQAFGVLTGIGVLIWAGTMISQVIGG